MVQKLIVNVISDFKVMTYDCKIRMSITLETSVMMISGIPDLADIKE